MVLLIYCKIPTHRANCFSLLGIAQLYRPAYTIGTTESSGTFRKSKRIDIPIRRDGRQQTKTTTLGLYISIRDLVTGTCIMPAPQKTKLSGFVTESFPCYTGLRFQPRLERRVSAELLVLQGTNKVSNELANVHMGGRPFCVFLCLHGYRRVISEEP